jgi:septal ring factor EnvC (AmiA/AmiB activator)
MDGDDPTTQDLRLGQLRREREEREQASHSVSDADEQAHERRADKAAYLRGKLAEREAAAREAAGREAGVAEDVPPGAGGRPSG